jgi:hypothetical protein
LNCCSGSSAARRSQPRCHRSALISWMWTTSSWSRGIVVTLNPADGGCPQKIAGSGNACPTGCPRRASAGWGSFCAVIAGSPKRRSPLRTGVARQQLARRLLATGPSLFGRTSGRGLLR